MSVQVCQDRIKRGQERWWIKIPFGQSIPRHREVIDLVAPDGSEYKGTVLVIGDTHWCYENGGLIGIEIDYLFDFEVTKESKEMRKSRFQVIKQNEL